MKHRLDKRTKPSVIVGLKMYKCQRCGVWTDEESRDCDGTKGRVFRERVIKSARGEFNKVLGDVLA